VGETPPVFAQAGEVPFLYVAHEAPAPQAEAIIVPKGSTLTRLADLRIYADRVMPLYQQARR
jgi:sulfonate transport system substrate-binding protein